MVTSCWETTPYAKEANGQRGVNGTPVPQSVPSSSSSSSQSPSWNSLPSSGRRFWIFRGDFFITFVSSGPFEIVSCRCVPQNVMYRESVKNFNTAYQKDALGYDFTCTGKWDVSDHHHPDQNHQKQKFEESTSCAKVSSRRPAPQPSCIAPPGDFHNQDFSFPVHVATVWWLRESGAYRIGVVFNTSSSSPSPTSSSKESVDLMTQRVYCRFDGALPCAASHESPQFHRYFDLKKDGKNDACVRVSVRDVVPVSAKLSNASMMLGWRIGHVECVKEGEEEPWLAEGERTDAEKEESGPEPSEADATDMDTEERPGIVQYVDEESEEQKLVFGDPAAVSSKKDIVARDFDLFSACNIKTLYLTCPVKVFPAVIQMPVSTESMAVRKEKKRNCIASLSRLISSGLFFLPFDYDTCQVLVGLVFDGHKRFGIRFRDAQKGAEPNENETAARSENVGSAGAAERASLWRRNRKVRRAANSNKYLIAVNRDLNDTLQRAAEYHVERSEGTWLTPLYIQVLLSLADASLCGLGFMAVELLDRTTHEVVAGCLGYSVGCVYQDFTMFTLTRDKSSLGNVLTMTIAEALQQCGYYMWDWGDRLSYMKTYEEKYGGRFVDRDTFFQEWNEYYCQSPSMSLATYLSTSKGVFPSFTS